MFGGKDIARYHDWWERYCKHQVFCGVDEYQLWFTFRKVRNIFMMVAFLGLNDKFYVQKLKKVPVSLRARGY